MTKRENRNIARIDINTPDGKRETHGWQVRFSREGKRITKFFSDSRNGGREGALDAARSYRDDLEAELPPPVSPEEAARRAAEVRSTSGVPGVRFQMREEGPYAWGEVIAEWIDPATGDRQKVTRSINRQGLRKALWRVCRERALGLNLDREELIGMFERAYGTIRRQYLEALPEGAEVRAI